MMMQYNPTTVSVTCEVYSMSVQCCLGIIKIPQLLLPLSAVHYTELYIIFNLLQKFQILSQVPFMKGKVWPFGNSTENNYNNYELII